MAASVIQGIPPQPTCRTLESRATRDMVTATRQMSMMNKMVVSTRVKTARSIIQIPNARFRLQAATIAQPIRRKVRPQNIGCITSGRMRAPLSTLFRSLI